MINTTTFNLDKYIAFLKRKFKLAQPTGFAFDINSIHPLLKPHQKAAAHWCIEGGRRAIFASFGLGKTFMQIEIAKAVVAYTGKPFLIGMPLSVIDEFEKDAKKLGTKVHFVSDQAEMDAIIGRHQSIGDPECSMIFSSNWEKIRLEKFDPVKLGGFSGDEASLLRSLDSQISDYAQSELTKVPYRFVATATPSPNEFSEILNYAQFLGIMDRGQALTRYFERNSTQAGDLQLMPHKKKEFWLWVHSWAFFITKPSLYGYSDEGYDLPEMKVIYHEVKLENRELEKDRRSGQVNILASGKGGSFGSKEKRNSLQVRIDKAISIIKENNPNDHWLIWHYLEDERRAIQKALPAAKSVYGTQKEDERLDYMRGFADGRYQYLSTKPEIAGQGCNFQRHCHKAVYVGITDMFNDFIQSIHRIYRFLQEEQVEIHIIHTDNEQAMLQRMQDKWQRHNEMIAYLEEIIKEYGLLYHGREVDMIRALGVDRKEVEGKQWKAVLNDNVLELANTPDNKYKLSVSSIPFGDQYEYVESVHDMGHNDGDDEFYEHMDFLTPEWYRVTEPGRIAAVHVKDRIVFSYQNGVGFTSLNDFSGKTVAHFIKHGWHLMAKITVPTDVVSENSSTYRLGWTENCKDGTKMGVGSPEYVLVFRKPPTDSANAYADVPVIKSKEDYSCGRWQLDAHAVWLTDGKKFLTPDELKQLPLKQIMAYWKQYATSAPYNYEEHVKYCERLEELKKLPTDYMIMEPMNNSEFVYYGVSRMRTLNTNQTNRKKEKHVCPLQFDIVDRLIIRYSNPGEDVLDPFGGLMTVPFRCIKLGRKGTGIELNEQYWNDGIVYCKEEEVKMKTTSLIDLMTSQSEPV